MKSIPPPPEPPPISEDGNFYWNGRKWIPIPPEGSTGGITVGKIAMGVVVGLVAFIVLLALLGAMASG